MKRSLRQLLPVLALLAVLNPGNLAAQGGGPGDRPAPVTIIESDAKTAPTQVLADAKTLLAANPAALPAPRKTPANWLSRHEGFVAEAKQGGIDLLFMGDSITDNWRTKGSSLWKQYYAPLHAANFGIGGDRTQHVLWRIENGELDGIKPKVIVLMIGTNNSQNDSPEQIAGGIKEILQCIRAKTPTTRILLLGVFPRNRANDVAAQMDAPNKVNALIAGFDDGRMVKFLDIGPKFLGPDGKVPADIMPDFLHPNKKGYQIWVDAMEGTLAEMMK